MKYINNFLQHLKNQNYSNNTLFAYKIFLSRFQRYLDSINIFDEKNLTLNIFNEYIARYKYSNLHSIYYKTVTVIKKYFRFLADYNYIFISPLESLKNPKQVIRHHPVLEKDEIIKIFNNFKDNKKSDIRLRAILELLYSSALRPSECLNLNISDIDFNNRMILVRKTKTKTDRIVPVTKQALLWINKYIHEVRCTMKLNDRSKKLFLSLKKKKASTLFSIQLQIISFRKQNNIRHLSLYSIRATSATHLFENGMSTICIQMLLGHKDLEATEIYIRVNFIHLKDTLDKFHPRNKLEYLNPDKKVSKGESDYEVPEIY